VAADEAAQSALAAVAAANYKGEWSTLAGALNIPASVSHNGVVYVLKANAANVAAITPGVSAQWLAAFSVPLYRLPILQANAGYAAASAMEVLGVVDFDSLLTGSNTPAYGCFSGSNYVVSAGATAGSVATSPDGETWTLRTMPASSAWGPMASDGAGKIMCGVTGSNSTAISTNHGVTWSACTAVGGTILIQPEMGLHHVGGLWLVMSGNNSNAYFTSADDGVTWVGRNFPALAPAGSEFRMVGNKLWFNWSTHAASVPAGTLVAGTHSDGSLWGAVGSVLHKTTDGITWTAQSMSNPVAGSLPAEVGGIKMVLSGSLVYTLDQGTWSARAKGLVTGVDLPNQYSARSFKGRGNVNGLFMQLGHVAGRVALIKPGSGSASGLYTKV
jgi:hypothetical protein